MQLLLLAAVAGCGTKLAFTPLAVPPRPLQPRAESTVEMFLSSKPKRPYVAVGTIGSAHEGRFSTDTSEEVLLALRTKAAEVGCDAVVLTSETDREIAWATGNQVSSTTLKTFEALCVVYSESAPAEAAPATSAAAIEAPQPPASSEAPP